MGSLESPKRFKRFIISPVKQLQKHLTFPLSREGGLTKHGIFFVRVDSLNTGFFYLKLGKCQLNMLIGKAKSGL